MKTDNIAIYFYGLNDQYYPVPIFSEHSAEQNIYSASDFDQFELWKKLADSISSDFLSQFSLQKTPLPFDLDFGTYQKSIIILFARAEHLTSINTYRRLPHSRIRSVSERGWRSPEKKKAIIKTDKTDKTEESIIIDSHPISNFNLQPIITIAAFDLMKFYESPTEQARDVSPPDSRFKFLDSGIWHRYVPLSSDIHESNFQHKFQSTLGKIISYHEANLYATNAARSTLELQLRLLENSFIERFGQEGHYKAVTPFKFHSESRMKVMADELWQNFFQLSIGEKTIAQSIQWRLLMIDDYAHEKISTFLADEIVACTWTKLELIKHVLGKPFSSRFEIEYSKAVHSGELPPQEDGKPSNQDPEQSAKYHLIETSLMYLKKGDQTQAFDILLLDYLLGRTRNSEQREYGHQFIQRLKSNTLNGETPFQLGPFGKFIIFPISSFPFAMEDKLKQLGEGNQGVNWRLFSGGDPISTPELFRYNFLKMLQIQVTECYLTDNALALLIGKYSFLSTPSLWRKILHSQFTELLLKLDLLQHFSNKSLFAKSITTDISHKYRNLLQAYHKLMEYVKEGISGAIAFKEFYQLWENTEEIYSGYYPASLRALKNVLLQIHAFKAIETAKSNIERVVKNEEEHLDLSGENLLMIPDNLIKGVSIIKSINFAGNHLENLPEWLQTFTQLESINLNNNPSITEFPKVIFSLRDQLVHVNLESTGLELGQLRASTKQEVQALCKRAKYSNLHDILKKAKSLIDDSRIKKVIPLILSLPQLDEEQRNTFDSLLRQWKALRKERKNGIINRDTYLANQNEIIEFILASIKEISID